MPIKKAAKKYMRVTAKKTVKNSIIKGVFKNAIKKTREAVAGGKVEDAQKWLKAAVQSLDKAAQKNVLKKNNVARKKSRLNKIVKALVKK